MLANLTAEAYDDALVGVSLIDRNHRGLAITAGGIHAGHQEIWQVLLGIHVEHN